MTICSIIIPTLNDEKAVQLLLTQLQPLRSLGHEVIVCDAGNQTNVNRSFEPLADLVLTSKPGRARQMNLAASKARGNVLWFLHADTQLTTENLIEDVLSVTQGNFCWGRFDVSLSGTSWIFSIIAFLMNLRSRLTSVSTGDQGIFVRTEKFWQLGGYADIPLMEDIVLSKSLRSECDCFCSRNKIMTSSRRWESRGIFRTILLMWSLRLAFFLGVSPKRLARLY